MGGRLLRSLLVVGGLLRGLLVVGGLLRGLMVVRRLLRGVLVVGGLLRSLLVGGGPLGAGLAVCRVSRGGLGNREDLLGSLVPGGSWLLLRSWLDEHTGEGLVRTSWWG